MKLSKIKIIAFILTVIMLSGLALNILSCAGSGDSVDDITHKETKDDAGSDGDDIKDDETPAQESKNSVEPRPDYDLPEKDLGKYEYRILSRSEGANLHWWNNDILSDEENSGDPINDAVYNRTILVEEKYNITIANIPDNSVGAKAAKSIKAGSDDYDLVVIGLRDGQDTLMNSGYLHDLNKVPYVDLSKPWWDQKAVGQLSINNKLFATSCDLTIRDKDATIIMMFNKKLHQEYELEDLYQLVKSGKWTLDKMFDMMKLASKDLNGDGQMDFDDQYGLLSQYRHSQYIFNAAGEYVSKLNADGVPEITLYSERSAAVCDKIKEYLGDKNTAVYAEQANGKYADIWDGFQVPFFADDRALFYHAGMNRVTLLRDMETDFGIVPPPKFDENQENYYVSVDAWCTSAVSVPITADIEKAGLILETLAYESRYILLPAYYDIQLKTKMARDEESKEMIDIILNNRLYDFGDIYQSWGGFVSYFEGLAQNKGDSLATFWDKNSAKIEAAMQKTINKILEMD